MPERKDWWNARLCDAQKDPASYPEHTHWCSQREGHKGWHKCWHCGHEWARTREEQALEALREAIRDSKDNGRHTEDQSGPEGKMQDVRITDRAGSKKRRRVAARRLAKGKGRKARRSGAGASGIPESYKRKFDFDR